MDLSEWNILFDIAYTDFGEKERLILQFDHYVPRLQVSGDLSTMALL